MKGTDVRIKMSGMKHWSKEEVEFLEENKDKLSAREIGEKLGRSNHAVIAKRHSLEKRYSLNGDADDLYFPVYSAEELNKMRKKLYLTLYDLAAYSGLHYQQVQKAVNGKGGVASRMLLGLILDDLTYRN